MIDFYPDAMPWNYSMIHELGQEIKVNNEYGSVENHQTV